MAEHLIRGAGGGGGGGKGGGGGGGGSARVAQEAPDSLRSRSYAQIIDLISEGEIVGLVDGLKSVYLDDTPIQNADGSMNFTGIALDSRVGTQTQSYIKGFSAVESETAVGLEVKTTASIVRTVTNSNINAVRVTIAVPSLTSQDKSTGDISGTSVTFAVDVQTNGGGYVQRVYDTISGKTTSRYERSYRIDLSGTGPWDIRVRRVTADSTSSALSNKTYWASYTEIVDAKLRYPNSALVGLRVDSSQFQSIPSRSYDMKLLKVKVPSNYNATTRVYTGAWDGTFQIAWTDNPAWCFYDLITNERYGLGRFVTAAQVDKWALYQIAKYCDEWVPNGLGGYEPRFTCNVYIQGRQDAYKVIQDFASCFRAMTHWATNSITAVQDAPADAVALFTNANVIDGTFSYQGSSSKARHTVALVRWNDPDDMFRQKVEYVEDRAGIDRYGYIETDVVAFACTSRGQANRVGRWLLFSERLETESVAFKTGLEGAVARPGQIIKVADADRAGSRQGGRIVSASGASVVLDSAPTNPVGGTLSIVAADGSILTATVATANGASLTVSPELPATPQANAIWILSTTSIQPQTFRVMSVAETGQGEYEIAAIAHDPGKYGAVENGLTLETRNFSNLSNPPDAPTNLTISENLYESAAEVKTKVTISWDMMPRATGYVVTYKIGNFNWITLPQTGMSSIDLQDMPTGEYVVKVVALNAIGKKSVAAEKTKNILGKTAPPANVQNFSLVPVAGMAMLSWDRATDLDVLVGGSVRIRHTSMTSSQDWSYALDIMPALPGTAQNATAPLLAGTYMAKFVDSSGIPSTDWAEIVTTVPQANALNVVATVTESPSYSGTKTNVAYDSSLGGLALVDGETAGTYVFANTTDLGGVYPCQITTNVIAYAVDRATVWDARANNIDDWQDIDGALVDDANAVIYMRTTNDDPSGTPTWTDWKPFFVGEYTARGFQFKVEFTSGVGSHTTYFTQLEVVIDMPDRVEAQSGIVSGAGTKSVSFVNPFKATPAIGITAQAMASGDYFTITSQSPTGFDIIFKNSAGTAVSRTFDVLAKGYGRKI